MKFGIKYKDDIDLSRFKYSSSEIIEMQGVLCEIENSIMNWSNKNNFEYFKKQWLKVISKVPFPIIDLDLDFILRSRLNEKEGAVFVDESDISYNSMNINKIKKNRFNRDEESVFYGTLPSIHQSKYVVATSIESYKELISDQNLNDVIYFTFGKWKIKESFPILNLCFDENIYEGYPGFRDILNNFHIKLKTQLSKDNFDFLIHVWKFISHVASMRQVNDQHFEITTALFSAIRLYYETSVNILINGLIYPSPMVYGQAINVVLMPRAVDKYLKLMDVFMFKYVRGLGNSKSFKTCICSKPNLANNGKLNISNINWGRGIEDNSY